MINCNYTKQHGLAAVELVLITPILLSICYLLLSVATSASLWEQRIVESRNAAYRTELFYGGNINSIDRFFLGVENILGAVAILLPDEAAEYNLGNKVKRYSISVENDLYADLITDTRSVAKNKFTDPRVFKDLTRILDAQSLDSTTGVGWSLYESPVGKLRNMFLKITNSPQVNFNSVFREKHTADFAQTLDLSSNNSLCLGYDTEMVAFLAPAKLNRTTFPGDPSRCRINPKTNLPDLPNIPSILPAFKTP